MTSVALGFRVLPLTVYLPADGNFVATLRAVPPWAGGTTIELRFATTATGVAAYTWTATILGTDATWNVAMATVQAVLAAKATYAEVHYITASASIPWMKGRVESQ